MEQQYGGQAVIEGVMMKGKRQYAVAVRKPDSEITVRLAQVGSLAEKFPPFKWPLLRGVLALVESVVLGIKALNYSANEALEDEEELKPLEMVMTVLVAFAAAVGLFVVLPAFIIRLVQTRIEYFLLLNLIEGLIKVAFLLTYIYLISRMEDIRRVFEYHGAEHKVIHAYEELGELRVEAARNYSPLHPRCGTSFLLIVILVSILLFSFFGRPPFHLRVLIHMGLLPLVAGLSYEIIKLAGRKQSSPLLRAVSLPGLMLQKLTTREPDDEQLEVALRALREVLEAEDTAGMTA